MERTKTLLPVAAYTTSERLVSLLKELLRGSVVPCKCFTGNPEDHRNPLGDLRLQRVELLV